VELGRHRSTAGRLPRGRRPFYLCLQPKTMRTPRRIWITLTLVALASCAWHLDGQTSIDLTRQGRLGSGTALPAQCAVGQIFLKSNAPAGTNLYICIAQNSWTAVGLSQGAAASRPVNCTLGQIWLSNDTGALTYCSASGSPGTWSSMLAGSAVSQIDAAGTPLTIRPSLNFGAGATCIDNSGANRTDCTFSGGGSGSVVLTSGAGAPGAVCAAPSSSNLAVYLDTTNQEEWWCSASNTWKKILSVTGVGPYEVVGGMGTAPSAPSPGNVACYFDATVNTQVCLDSSGNATTMVRVWHGTAALGTNPIASAACSSETTAAAIGVTPAGAHPDVVTVSWNGDPTGVAGYVPATTGALTIFAYPKTDAVGFKVCNYTGASITPGPITLNWRVSR
jgi:hypothetical protein